MRDKDDEKSDQKDIKALLERMENKVLNAKVLNGGFDKLVSQVDEIKSMQVKLNTDFQVYKSDQDSIREKIDRLYDPEEGIYAKVNKTEVMVNNLTSNINHLSVKDEKLEKQLEDLDDTGKFLRVKIEKIDKITGGDDHTDLRKAISVSKGLWALGVFVGTAVLGAAIKLIWELVVAG